MKILKKILFIILMVTTLSIFGCKELFQKEIARVKAGIVKNHNNPQFHSTTLNLKQGEIVYLWTDVDVEFTGDIDFIYLVKVTGRDNRPVKYEIRPLEDNQRKVTLNERKIVFNNKTKWSFSCYYYTYKADTSGEYTFESVLAISAKSKGASFAVNKSDLVLKK